MKKILSAFICFLCLSITIISMVGCSDTKAIVHITDMERFADMQESADSIDVEFDNHTGKPFKFTVEDENDIAEIMNIILTDELNNLGKEFPPGDNTFFTIHQGEKSYSLSVRINSEKDTYYAFSTDKLQSKIIDLATEQGAYGTMIGIAYKVINLSEIDNEHTLAGSYYDKTAILDLITSDKIADYRFVCLLETENETDAYYNLTLSETSAYTYVDRVTMSEGKLLVMYEIYQTYDLTSYYIIDTLPNEFINLTIDLEFVLGLYRPYTVRITIVS